MFTKKKTEEKEEMQTGKGEQSGVLRRVLEGTVVSDKMDKTRVVAVTRHKKHRLYAKYFGVTKRYKAHDAGNEYHTGDIVQIAQCRPLSRDKKWIITGVIKRNPNQQIRPNSTNEESESTVSDNL
jgi:small subunit ribosomal protein S17